MPVIFTFLLGVVIVLFSSHHEAVSRYESRELLVPPQDIKLFALGYHEILADSLWLRVIQDFDQCGRDADSNVTPIPSGRDVIELKLKQRIGRCENSWVYKMIDAVTELAPDFRVAYSSGGVILSVAVDDIVGAGRIYSKAVEKFPEDWQIAYKAAYHYLYEMADRQKAADLLIVASKQPGAPYWFPMLAARLYSKTGAATLGKAVMDDFIAKNPDHADNPHVKKRMAEIERDLAAGDDAPEPAAKAPAQQPTELPKEAVAQFERQRLPYNRALTQSQSPRAAKAASRLDAFASIPKFKNVRAKRFGV